MARPDVIPPGDKDRPSYWPCAGHRPANVVRSIDQLLPPKAAIPHLPLFTIAQFETRQLLPLQVMAAKPTVGV